MAVFDCKPLQLQTGPSDELELRVSTVDRTQPQLESKIIIDFKMGNAPS